MREKGNILNLFGATLGSKLPKVFYDCEVSLSNEETHIINKLFLFITTRTYALYQPSIIYPVDHGIAFKDISGYFYDSRFSNLDHIGSFDIKGFDRKSEFIIKGVSVKRNSSDFIFSYHSFYAMNFEYINSRSIIDG